jgi:hypothetical protein
VEKHDKTKGWFGAFKLLLRKKGPTFNIKSQKFDQGSIAQVTQWGPKNDPNIN